ncbi:DNA-3-methyladenine glycosylase I [Salidesulfovibrio onnuriiensis]|uniref:DNA-3-methyladenine glycosylase I n=1 Tax=Salidesulfovibrio onnuriiensis TaxID=2583823 RepID=UPI0011C9DF88|nr:DNA-3-methyladenine glycosylase I [Salidesulfovibrio onnuriiensis]
MEPNRCSWARHPLEIEYHDKEWGVPVRDDNRQFEFLMLESAQAGLSWLTILKRREGYRAAFAGFDPHIVARFDQARIEELLRDERIIRNRRKVEAAVKNARAFLDIQEQFGSFCNYIWEFVDGSPIQNTWTKLEELPPSTPLSEALAKDLKRRGFAFLGPTTIYAHMQAAGLVNDHLVSCHRHEAIRAMA